MINHAEMLKLLGNYEIIVLADLFNYVYDTRILTRLAEISFCYHPKENQSKSIANNKSNEPRFKNILGSCTRVYHT